MFAAARSCAVLQFDHVIEMSCELAISLLRTYSILYVL